MKSSSLLAIVLALFAGMLLPGCAVVGGIFKAGVWVGILAVVLVIVIIVAIASRAKK